jgi:hypothetical protein
MTSPNCAGCFWKSACWIRLISDPPQAVATVLMDTAKRYRVDTEKLQKAVAEELAAKRDKKTKAKAKPKARKTAA